MTIRSLAVVVLVVTLALLAIPSVSSAIPDSPATDDPTQTWFQPRSSNNGGIDEIFVAAHGIDGGGRNVEYIGGSFDFIGPNSGPIGAVDLETQTPILNFLAPNQQPAITGDITAFADDGTGGTFVAIDVSSTVHVVKRITAEGMLDTTFAVTVMSGTKPAVNAMSVEAGALYLAGQFYSVAGASRANLAAVDTSTGSATSWNPNANGAVNDLVIANDNVFIGGSFTTVNGSTRNRLAAVELSTGQPTAWSPSIPSGTVKALAVSQDLVMAGGTFTSANGSTRNRFAAFSADTGNLSSFAPSFSDEVRDIAADAENIFVVGKFTSVDSTARYRVASFDSSTHSLESWAPEVNGPINVVNISGQLIFLGGEFSKTTASWGESFAAAHLVLFLRDCDDCGGPPSETNGPVLALAASGTKMLVGGDFDSAGGLPRKNVAAIDVNTGLPTEWGPEIAGTDTDPVRAILPVGDRVLIGGHFSAINGVSRHLVGAVDNVTGATDTTWQPDLTFTPSGSPAPGRGVHALQAFGPHSVFAGGHFTITQGGEQVESTFASIDLFDGHISSWAPDGTRGYSTHRIWDFEIDDGKMYIARDNNVLVCDLTDGSTEEFADTDRTGSEVGADNYAVDVIDDPVRGKRVYIGGSFRTVNGQWRPLFASLDSFGNVLDELPENTLLGQTSTIYDIEHNDERIFVSGYSMAFDGVERRGLAAFDRDDLTLDPWNPTFGVAEGWSNTIDLNGSSLYSGNRFRYQVFPEADQ
jgi:hypothetical protein